ncbi:MAG: aminotransferase class I/II-fold pyridoxal phosphate-dependent enzyme, partial [Chitinophagaceae bacterium]
ALTTILQPNDEVIVFEPAYDSYIPNIEINGGIAVSIALEEDDFSIPWHKVSEKISPKTKAIIINSPHNPTGKVLTEYDIRCLQKIVQNTNIFIISDEVYEHLIYDSLPHLSLLKYPDLFERSFVCFSFGKTYHCTGWKLGYCIAPSNLMHEFRKVHQFNAFSCDTPKQVALANYITNKDAYSSLGNILQQKRDYFRNLMKQTVFTCIPSNGSYFECYSYKNISDISEAEMAIKLTKEFGVATIPLSAFYKKATDNKTLRFCFAKQETTLEKAVEKLIHFKG